MKSMGVTPPAATWMDPGMITNQNQVRERKIPSAITYMSNLKNYISDLIYKAEADSQTQEANTVTRGDEEKGRIRGLGLTYTLHLYGKDNQQGPAQHREHIQDPVKA